MGIARVIMCFTCSLRTYLLSPPDPPSKVVRVLRRFHYVEFGAWFAIAALGVRVPRLGLGVL